MSILDRVRETYGVPAPGADRTDDRRPPLPPNLERRIRRMATRWEYSPAELRDVLTRARLDPHGWACAVALDERREAEFRQRGLLPRADA